eukprot:TRINITY_DN15449_c0_g1_i1.p1 TRINITY_DN15449_c0_g1~~TRINITY_DN15449_c0_g1_i1.p1  ORF type:complete len:243 (+),score=23.80 TRINITY_DN15449_c0_g1_i1:100-828(+)
MALFMTAHQPWDEAMFGVPSMHGASIPAPYAYSALGSCGSGLFASHPAARFRKPSLEPAPFPKRVRFSLASPFKGAAISVSSDSWAVGPSQDVPMGNAVASFGTGAVASRSGVSTGHGHLPLTASREHGNAHTAAVSFEGSEARCQRTCVDATSHSGVRPVAACGRPQSFQPERSFESDWCSETYRDHCTDIVPFVSLRDTLRPRQLSASEDGSVARLSGVDITSDDDEECEEGYLGAMYCS